MPRRCGKDVSVGLTDWQRRNSEAELLRNDGQAITDVCVGRGCRLHIVGPDARHHAELISRLDVALAEDETLAEDKAELVAA